MIASFSPVEPRKLLQKKFEKRLNFYSRLAGAKFFTVFTVSVSGRKIVETRYFP